MNLIKEVPAGTPEEINVIVEIPKGSKNKYEIDKETGLIALDRVMHTSQDMPFDYGFVPQTLWEDGDPLDVVLLTTYPLHPGILVKVRPVGMMDMVDDGESDVKIIAVPVKDPRWADVQDLSDVNKHTLKEMEHYFTTYKKLQNKEVVIKGFGDKKDAMEAFTKATKAFVI
ncbi:MAG: inorganic diphosphatase [Minisyncoccota bacterium]